ncbi:MAG: cutinase family protein [Candidatus Nanopelagicales bacterium]
MTRNRLRNKSSVRAVGGTTPVGAGVLALVAVFTLVGATSLSGSAVAEPTSADCADVISLAVPGTWETNEHADRNVVPGMLANITGPVEQAIESGAPEVDLGSNRTPIASGTQTARPSTRQLPVSSGREITVNSESIPYVAQVGGPIAGIVTGSPVTLAQSKAAGKATLEARVQELATACPLAKFVILGYSQGAKIAGDFLSAVGTGRFSLDPSRILAGALLSDPSRTPSTPDPEADSPTADPVKLTSVAETMVGPNTGGQGVLGEADRQGGMGVLAERVTTFCAQNDAICSLSGKSKAVAAIVPLLNLTPEDIPTYLMNKGVELLQNVASADPQVLARAASSVITQMTQLTVAGSLNPASLPLEIARVIFASTMLDDVARVINMPEFDALVSLTNPEELVQQVSQVGAYLLLDAHRSYASYTVDSSGDSATQWVVKWVTNKVQAGI